MNEEQSTNIRDEADIARLLAKVGRRRQPSVHAAAAVRAAVEAEWRDVVSAREQGRRYTRWAVAAGVAVAAVGAWLARPLYLPGPVPVATVARVTGDVQVESAAGRWEPLVAGRSVDSGAEVRTGAAGRAALDLGNGVRLRLDAGTQLALNDPEEASLQRGAVYVDSGTSGAGRAPGFVLDTPEGEVRHLGTQYAARLDGAVLRIGIREGRVEVSGPRATVVGAAGEALEIGAGRVTRSALPPSAAEWNWVAEVTPPFSIEGRTVEEFLAWAGRETGRTVVYASPDVERTARQVTLSGTVEGLPPREAIAAVLATTSLATNVADDRIEVRHSTR